MCGRYTLTKPFKKIKEHFKAVGKINFVGRYNVAPKQDNLVVVAVGNKREFRKYRWGLIPHWSKDESMGSRLINARAETIEEKTSFESSFKSKRCLVPADGFIEWKKVYNDKQPYYIHLKSKRLFAMAGIWEEWEGKEGIIPTYSILTKEANPVIAKYHERMPVILPLDCYDLWLNKETPVETLRPILASIPEEKMEIYQIAKRVNSPKNDDSKCITRVT